MGRSWWRVMLDLLKTSVPRWAMLSQLACSRPLLILSRRLGSLLRAQLALARKNQSSSSSSYPLLWSPCSQRRNVLHLILLWVRGPFEPLFFPLFRKPFVASRKSVQFFSLCAWSLLPTALIYSIVGLPRCPSILKPKHRNIETSKPDRFVSFSLPFLSHLSLFSSSSPDISHDSTIAFMNEDDLVEPAPQQTPSIPSHRNKTDGSLIPKSEYKLEHVKEVS